MAVLCGLGAYTFVYAEGFSYFSNDPKVCTNCHIMREQYDSWLKGSHHTAATCNDCHVPAGFVARYFAKGEHGYRHSKAFTLQDFHEPIQITKRDLEIVQANCERCHGAIVQEMLMRGDRPSDRAVCTQCHSGVGHQVRN